MRNEKWERRKTIKGEMTNEKGEMGKEKDNKRRKTIKGERHKNEK